MEKNNLLIVPNRLYFNFRGYIMSATGYAGSPVGHFVVGLRGIIEAPGEINGFMKMCAGNLVKRGTKQISNYLSGAECAVFLFLVDHDLLRGISVGTMKGAHGLAGGRGREGSVRGRRGDNVPGIGKGLV